MLRQDSCEKKKREGAEIGGKKKWRKCHEPGKRRLGGGGIADRLRQVSNIQKESKGGDESGVTDQSESKE